MEVDRLANEALWSAVVDPDRRIRVTKVLHAKADRYVGRFVDELFGTTAVDPTAALLGVAENGVPIAFEAPLHGAARDHVLSIHAFSEGDEVHLSGVVHDLTENRARLDGLLAVLTHELAAPLTVIGGYAELLANRLDAGALTDASARTGVAAIERNVQSLGQLLASLADARDNVRPIEHMRLDIAALLGGLRDELDSTLEGREVTWELPAAPLFVEGDPAGLRQVAANLLDNALKFSPSGSPIDVLASGDNDNVTVRIIDHGPGVPVERTSELFGRFARLGSTRRGLGLGLYLARAIARRHRGDLTYESTTGGGATFVLTVPRNAGSEES